jgi:hypothetical protein
MGERDDRPQEEIVEGDRLSEPAPPPEALRDRPNAEADAPDGIGNGLELPSLERSLINDEAERRTRRIHLVFKRVFAFMLVAGLLSAADAVLGGRPDMAALALGTCLVLGAIIGGFAALAYAMIIAPAPDITGAQELARRQREARKAVTARRATTAEGHCGASGQPEDPTPDEVRKKRIRTAFKWGLLGILILGFVCEAESFGKRPVAQSVWVSLFWICFGAIFAGVGAFFYATLLEDRHRRADLPYEGPEVGDFWSGAARRRSSAETTIQEDDDGSDPVPSDAIADRPRDEPPETIKR